MGGESQRTGRDGAATVVRELGCQILMCEFLTYTVPIKLSLTLSNF